MSVAYWSINHIQAHVLRRNQLSTMLQVNLHDYNHARRPPTHAHTHTLFCSKTELWQACISGPISLKSKTDLCSLQHKTSGERERKKKSLTTGYKLCACCAIWERTGLTLIESERQRQRKSSIVTSWKDSSLLSWQQNLWSGLGLWISEPVLP